MKDAQINIRLSADMKKQLDEKAENAGMTSSEYVRYLITKELQK